MKIRDIIVVLLSIFVTYQLTLILVESDIEANIQYAYFPNLIKHWVSFFIFGVLLGVIRIYFGSRERKYSFRFNTFVVLLAILFMIPTLVWFVPSFAILGNKVIDQFFLKIEYIIIFSLIASGYTIPFLLSNDSI